MTISVNDVLVKEDGTQAIVTAIDNDSATLEWKDGDDVKSEVVPLSQLELHETKLDKEIGGGKTRADRTKAWKEKMKKKKLHEDESEAMQTLHPNTRPAGDDPKSKLEIISQAIGTMASMQDHQLEKFWNDAVALVGKEADKLPAGANAEANKASIKAKPSVAVGEDLANMFDGQELSEEFKEKASTLFEAALSSRLTLETVKLQEAYDDAERKLVENYQSLLDESIDEITDQLSSGLESYLDYVAEEWITENKVAIESTLRNELMDDFIHGLKELFADHYIEVPEDKIDAFEVAVQENEELKNKLNTAIHENTELKTFRTEKVKEDMIEESAAGLNATQTQRFYDLCADLDFDNPEVFQKKISTIKESYFISNKKPVESNILTEQFDGDTKTKAANPEMKAYSNAIKRTVKKY